MVTVKRKKKLIRFEDVETGTFFSYPDDWTCGCCLKFTQSVRTREEMAESEDFCDHYNAFVYPEGNQVEFYSDDMVEVLDVSIEIQ